MSSIRRRRFFEESMIATAAIAAMSQKNILLAEDDQKSSAAETLSHAVIGCRIRGKVHAKEFGKLPNVNISYVCDPDRDLAEQLANEVEKDFGKRPQVVQDLRKIFDDTSVDTVSVATPNHWHALASIWAMQSGKDVYCEKPVSNTVVEGRRMVQVARKTGRICQAGTQNRSIGAHKAIVDYIQQGKLGEISLARTIIYGQRGSIGAKGNYPIPPQVDYNLWLGPGSQETLTRPQLHYDWHWVWDTGNGELGNNNIHYIDLVRWMMGLTGLGDSVVSIGGRVGYIDAGETPNTQLVIHRFGKASIIQEVRGLKTEPFSPKFNAGWVITGSEGFIAGTSLFDPEGNLVQTFSGTSVNHFANFIEAVRQRKAEILNADIAEGHQSTALCHIGNISHRLGRLAKVTEIESELAKTSYHPEVAKTFERLKEHLVTNKVDLDTTDLTLGSSLQCESGQEKFTDAKANELLTRTYRKPFELPSESNI